MSKRGRVVATYSRPGGAPRCVECDEAVRMVTTRPQDMEVEQLRRWFDRIEASNPPPGAKVKARTPYGVVWACPFHTPGMVKMIGRTRRGKQHVEWKIETRAEA